MRRSLSRQFTSETKAGEDATRSTRSGSDVSDTARLTSREDRDSYGKGILHSECIGNDVSVGVAQSRGPKDQDRYDVRVSTSEDQVGFHYISVIDGHGTSAFAADLCASSLYDEICGDPSIEEGKSCCVPMPGNDEIAKGYLTIDDAIRQESRKYPRSGACVVSLFLTKMDDGMENVESLRGKVAWAGDSRAIMITQDVVAELTLDHRVDTNPSELERIEACDHTPRAGIEESDMWVQKVKETKGKARERLRPHSFCAQREIKGVPYGPTCVFSHSGGVSLQISRSVGDIYGPRSVIPDPDFTEFEYSSSEYTRFVLASDGLFDVLPSREVAKFVSRHANPKVAASKLAAYAKQKRFHVGVCQDDITVIVVDVNPQLRGKNYKFNPKAENINLAV